MKNIKHSILITLSKLFFVLFLSLLPSNSAINFNGVDNRLVIPYNADLMLTNSFTISVWINMDNLPTTVFPNYRDTIYTVRQDSAPFEGISFLVDGSNGVPGRLAIYNGSAGQFFFTTAAVISTGQWFHVAVTYDDVGDVASFYVNGSLAEQNPAYNVNFPDTGMDPNIGREGVNYPFDGSIDDVRIYDRVLSSTEIEALHASRRKRIGGNLVNGLIAHFEMDDRDLGEQAGQVLDLSGNNNHGEISNFDDMTTIFSTDIPSALVNGTSMLFDGVDDVITVAGSSSGPLHNIGTGDFTVAVWATNTSSVAYNELIANFNSGNGLLFGTAITSNNLHAYVGSGASNSASIAYVVPTDNSWHYYVLTRNSGTCQVYVDGNIQGASFAAADTLSTTVSTYVGARNTAASEPWPGNIDDMRIYNRALSLSEISFLYNGSGMNPGTSNLEALWTFDDTLVKDSTGNDNHGTGLGGTSLQYSEGVVNRN